MRGLYQALAVASMCVQEQAAARPLIADVVTALSYLANQEYDPAAHNIMKPKAERNEPMVCSRWDHLDGSEKQETANMLNRERAVAEAKMWVEKRRHTAS
ncbi:hypothetical protein R6Q57_015019 [Mikania cordata]